MWQGNTPMATYRVFTLGNDNRIVKAAIIDCQTDDEAMSRAPDFCGDHKAVEVWQLGRCVGHVDLRANAA
jgi:hypothetical protein